MDDARFTGDLATLTSYDVTLVRKSDNGNWYPTDIQIGPYADTCDDVSSHDFSIAHS